MSKFLLMIVALTFALVGCSGDGGSSSNNLSEADSQEAFLAVSNAASAATSGAYGCTTCLSQPLSTSIEFEFQCSQGGTISVEGDIDIQDAFAYDLALNFNNCSHQDVEIDGGIDYFITGDSAQDIAIRMEGSLDFSGEISGSCDIDVTISIAGGFSGDFCGNSF
jgi:hypothetical protein